MFHQTLVLAILPNPRETIVPVQTPKYCYRVDADDVLVAVDALWLAFAQENGAAALTEPLVLGRSLWDFVEDKTTQGVYREIHARVRSSGKPVMLPFRCDSPTLKRHMRLTITQDDAGHLMYESILLRAEAQPYVGVLDPGHRRTTAVLTLCSCCKRALLETEGWLEIEDVCVRLGLLEAPRVPQLRHTVCPECADIVRTSIENGDAA